MVNEATTTPIPALPPEKEGRFERTGAMRMEGWEARLDRMIENARNEPYAIGTHDCFRLACSVTETLTGIDRWPEFAGYRTRREALSRIHAHGRTFEAAGDWFFGRERVPAAMARRGDIVLLAPDGTKHLGVCLGERSALITANGISFVPTASATGCWRIG